MKFTGTLALALALVTGMSVCNAEDWTTTDGKTYTGVKVVAHDDASVTILDSDGGATIPLRLLSPQLQATFSYDPAKAKAAEAAHAAQEQKDADAVAAERTASAQQVQAVLKVQSQAAKSNANQQAEAQRQMEIEDDQQKLTELQSRYADQYSEQQNLGRKNNTTTHGGLDDSVAELGKEIGALKKEIAQLQTSDKAAQAAQQNPTTVPPAIAPAPIHPPAVITTYAPPGQQQPSQPTTVAFHCFVRDLEAESKLVNGIYQGGELAGMNKTQVYQFAGRRWVAMQPEEKSIYQDEAKAVMGATQTSTAVAP